MLREIGEATSSIVAKLLRVYGGCSGIGGRRKTW